MCGNTAESAGVDFSAEAVAYFAFRIKFDSFLKADLNFRLTDILNDFPELKHLYFTDFRVVLDLDIDLTSEFFFGCKPQCFFKPLDENFAVYSFIFTDLFYDTLYISYKH